MERLIQPSPRTRRFTVDEVLRMVDAGILGPDEPLELIEGELIEVTPQGPEHATCVGEIQDLLAAAYAGIGHVRVQMPLRAGSRSLPEPDLAVAQGPRSRYRARHPDAADVLLVVEVAQSSLAYDRSKAAVYARAGVSEYWVIDLAARRAEVHREPAPDGYARVVRLSAGDALALPRLTGERRVGELFP
jgi:hypothetical protein